MLNLRLIACPLPFFLCDSVPRRGWRRVHSSRLCKACWGSPPVVGALLLFFSSASNIFRFGPSSWASDSLAVAQVLLVISSLLQTLVLRCECPLSLHRCSSACRASTLPCFEITSRMRLVFGFAASFNYGENVTHRRLSPSVVVIAASTLIVFDSTAMISDELRILLMSLETLFRLLCAHRFLAVCSHALLSLNLSAARIVFPQAPSCILALSIVLPR